MGNCYVWDLLNHRNILFGTRGFHCADIIDIQLVVVFLLKTAFVDGFPKPAEKVSRISRTKYKLL